MFALGLPMGTVAAFDIDVRGSERSAYAMQNSVASVGPYRLQKVIARAAERSVRT